MFSQRYEDYIKMIDSEVSRIHKDFRWLERNELKSEANLIFSVCYNKYDPNKAKFSTYLTDNLNKRLWRFAVAETVKKHSEYVDDFSHAKECLNLSTITKHLSDDAKRIVNLIVSKPSTILLPTGYTKISLRAIWSYLSFIEGWNTKKIMMIISEIKDNLEV
jgi:hypothetical protein